MYIVLSTEYVGSKHWEVIFAPDQGRFEHQTEAYINTLKEERKILRRYGANSTYQAGLLKWPTRADCKSADISLREFKSLTRHQF
jgi:hypothetical protein